LANYLTLGPSRYQLPLLPKRIQLVQTTALVGKLMASKVVLGSHMAPKNDWVNRSPNDPGDRSTGVEQVRHCFFGDALSKKDNQMSVSLAGKDIIPIRTNKSWNWNT
jgi:hypothetical protein